MSKRAKLTQELQLLSVEKSNLQEELEKVKLQDDRVSVALTTDLRKQITKLDSRITKKKLDLQALPTEDEEAEARKGVYELVKQFIDQQELYYVSKDNGMWVQYDSDKMWVPRTTKALRETFEGGAVSLTNEETWNTFQEVMTTENRKTNRINYIWSKDTVVGNTLNLLRYDFCKEVPIETMDEKPHWFLDLLIRNLGGHKKENIEHIEKLIIRKWLHPEDYVIPGLVFSGDEGGAGKGLFTEHFLPTVFGRELVAPNLSIEQVCGKFNGSSVGKAVAHVNESSEEKGDKNRLKALAHSKTMMSEEKFQSSFEVNVTFWLIFSGNNVVGTIRLDGGETDRRFSVVSPTTTLSSILMEKLNCSLADTKQWISTVGIPMLEDPTQVGKWLYEKHMQHLNDVEKPIPALHGEDYKKLVKIQENYMYEVCDAVFKNPKFTHIQAQTLYNCYAQLSKENNQGRAVLGRTTFYATLAQQLPKRYPNVTDVAALRVADTDTNNNVKYKSVRCYVKDHMANKQHTHWSANDHKYMAKDDRGAIVVRFDPQVIHDAEEAEIISFPKRA